MFLFLADLRASKFGRENQHVLFYLFLAIYLCSLDFFGFNTQKLAFKTRMLVFFLVCGCQKYLTSNFMF
jgi:hypothetical protein